MSAIGPSTGFAHDRQRHIPHDRQQIRTPFCGWSRLLGIGALLLGLASAPAQGGDREELDRFWHHPLPPQGQPPEHWSDQEGGIGPDTCASCHEAIASQWRGSLHAQTMQAGVLGLLAGLPAGRGEGCLDCHAPLDEQRQARQSGIDQDGLLNTGVNCAACHLRGHRRYGPPPGGGRPNSQRADPPFEPEGIAHDGFVPAPWFSASFFCASCHQLPQDSNAPPHAPPLMNTYEEWRESPFAAQGIQCQGCHMPEGEHRFVGIHDPEMVRRGLKIELEWEDDGASMTITSQWIGHRFPTYAAARVEVVGRLKRGDGLVIAEQRWLIGREVIRDPTGGWRGLSDTRLRPGERRTFRLSDAHDHRATQAEFAIRVDPRAFYRDDFSRLLLAAAPPWGVRRYLKTALQQIETTPRELGRWQLERIP